MSFPQSDALTQAVLPPRSSTLACAAVFIICVTFNAITFICLLVCWKVLESRDPVVLFTTGSQGLEHGLTHIVIAP